MKGWPWHLMMRKPRSCLRQIAGGVVLHYSDFMTRYRGRIHSEAPTVRSGRSTRTSLVEPAERIHVFVPPVVNQVAEPLLAQEQTIRVGPMPFTPAATGAHPLDSDEGGRR